MGAGEAGWAASAFPRVSGALESIGISLARQAAELSDVAGADLAFLGHMSHAQLRALGEECMALPESARGDFVRELVWRRCQDRGAARRLAKSRARLAGRLRRRLRRRHSNRRRFRLFRRRLFRRRRFDIRRRHSRWAPFRLPSRWRCHLLASPNIGMPSS